MEAGEKELETIEVITLNDGISAKKKQYSEESRVFKIQEIMMGVGKYRKAVPYTKKFLQPQTVCKAQVLKNGKLRIV